MASESNSIRDYIGSLVINIAHSARDIVEGRNLEKAILLSKEVFTSLSKEPVLTQDKVSAAFEAAMKSLGEFERRCGFLQSTYQELLKNFTQLQKRQAAFKTNRFGLSLISPVKIDLALQLADVSQLWHIAIERLKKNFNSEYPIRVVGGNVFESEEFIKMLADEIDETFQDHSDHVRLASDMVEELAGDVFNHLLDGAIKEIDQVRDKKKKNCGEKDE